MGGGSSKTAPKKASKLEEQRKEMRALFKKYDRDHSGSIDAKEFEALLFDLKILWNSQQQQEALAQIDTSHNHKIEIDEFESFYFGDHDGSRSGLQKKFMEREIEELKARLTHK